MPDVKPRPRAGAIRLSLTRADQKGTRSASVLVIVACIPDPRIDSRPATEAHSRPRLDGFINGLRPKCPNRKKVGLWLVLIQQNLSCSRQQLRTALYRLIRACGFRSNAF